MLFSKEAKLKTTLNSLSMSSVRIFLYENILYYVEIYKQIKTFQIAQNKNHLKVLKFGER